MKLNRRIILVTTVWLFIILLVVNSAVYLFFKQFMEESELNQISDQGQAAIETIGNHPTPSLLMDNYLIGEGMLRVVRSDDRIGKTLTKNPAYRNIPATYTTSQEAAIVTYENAEYAISRQPLIWDDGSIVTLELVESIEHYSNALRLLQTVLLTASLLVLIPSFIAGQLLSRFILTPIRTLIGTMDEISRKGTFKKINVTSKQTDELAQMSATFNHMIELLQQNFEKQQQFVSDASHELKTPLTVIESYARLLKRWGKKDPAILDEAVEAIYSEALRMRGMTQQMLDLAMGDNQTVQPMSRLHLSSIIKETAERISHSFNREIQLSADENIYVLGHENTIKQLLFILLENGIKYSEQALHVQLYSDQNQATIEIKDTGIGIPLQDQPQIFERFFRVSEDRNRQSGGSGLGLSIAKKIVEQYSGTIRVHSELGKGSTFIVSLPIHQSEEE